MILIGEIATPTYRHHGLARHSPATVFTPAPARSSALAPARIGIGAEQPPATCASRRTVPAPPLRSRVPDVTPKRQPASLAADARQRRLAPRATALITTSAAIAAVAIIGILPFDAGQATYDFAASRASGACATARTRPSPV